MAETQTQFDPWDWLGVHCGGYFPMIDLYIMAFLDELRVGHPDVIERRDPETNKLFQLICTLLCNTDAFMFDGDPTNLRWIGDDRFRTLDQLIEAWDAWYRERYS